MTEVRLTTIDNPYDPFEDFEHWYLYDIELGHNCCELLARFAMLSDSMTDKENDSELNRAIDEIILNDPMNVFKKVTKKDS